MKFSTPILCILALLATSSVATSQNLVIENPLMNDGTGRPQNIGPDMAVDGSPYLFDEYLPGEMRTTDGVILRNYKLRFSLVDNTMYYLLPDGKEMKLTTPIQSFCVFRDILKIGQSEIAKDTVKVTALNKILNASGTPVYLAYAEGKLNFLKKVNVTYTDKKEYGTTNITRVFTRKESYVVTGIADSPVRLNKNESGVLDILNDQRKQVKAFVQSNNLSYKSDQDLVMIFSHYNSL